MAANMAIDDAMMVAGRWIEEGQLEYFRVVNIVLAKGGLFFVLTTEGIWEIHLVKDIRGSYNGSWLSRTQAVGGRSRLLLQQGVAPGISLTTNTSLTVSQNMRTRSGVRFLSTSAVCVTCGSTIS